ncbi:MAG: hypothetical protein K6G65_00665 [Lachnospiraceae bacterium]|nr:hypothetical protein [Lachnospiraceae bacterium]
MVLLLAGCSKEYTAKEEGIYNCVCYNGELYHETEAGTLAEPEKFIGKITKTVKEGYRPTESLSGTEDTVEKGDEFYIFKEDPEAIYHKSVLNRVGEADRDVYVRYAKGAYYAKHVSEGRYDLNVRLNGEVCYNNVRYELTNYLKKETVDEKKLRPIGTLKYASFYSTAYEDQELYTNEDFHSIGRDFFISEDEPERIYEDAGDEYVLFMKLKNQNRKKTYFEDLGLCKDFENSEEDGEAVAEKPVIYVYPKEDNTKLTVTIKHNEPLDVEYPISKNGSWDIVADTDGTLHYEGRDYKYLYWEDNSEWDMAFEKGFCVKKEDSISFLENALTKLGLTEKEQDDFISYWLPRLYENEWNLISFNPAAYEKEYGLEVSKKANIINVFALIKGLDKKVSIEPQDLTKMNEISRDELTVVSWGGTFLNEK